MIFRAKLSQCTTYTLLIYFFHDNINFLIHGNTPHHHLPHLVRSTNEVQIMLVEKLGDNVRAKCEGDPSVVLSPSLRVLVRVGP